MIRRDRRVFIAASGLALIGGCATPLDPFTPAVDDVAEGDRKPVEGGIGGTGIVGVVTALGSIRVNGLRIGIADDTEVVNAFGPLPPSALRRGMSVTVEAAEAPGRLVARRVVIDHPLIGRVSRISPDGRRLRVLGTEVRLEPTVNAPIAEGDTVAVSGLWRRGAVVASRIDRLAEPGPSVMAGEIAAGTSGLALGGLTLSLPSGTALTPGQFATLIGQPDGTRFDVARLRPARFVGAAGPLVRLSVEGYLSVIERAPGFAISGLGHSFDRGARLAGLSDDRAVFVGPYAQTFRVAAALPLPTSPWARARALSDMTPLQDRPDALSTR
ncbi:MAG: DUF5666 domain-containing protein [Pikeienuella sp.]